MKNTKQKLRVMAELVESSSALVSEAARQDSLRAFGRSHGEQQLAQYTVLAGMKLEDYAAAWGVDLDAAIAKEHLNLIRPATSQDTDYRMACSILSNVTILATLLDSDWESEDTPIKIGRIFVELDRLAQKCGTNLRETMRAGRNAQNLLFSEYRCPSP